MIRQSVTAMFMEIKANKTLALALLPLLASCGFERDKKIDGLGQYEGCYRSSGLSIKLEEGLVKSQNSRYIYIIQRKKIGIVMASNFFLNREKDKSINLLPNSYEKFYLINGNGIRITDSDNYVHNFTRVDMEFCKSLELKNNSY